MRVELKGCAALATIQGASHSTNQDRFRLLTREAPIVEDSERGQIFAVFDGMGSCKFAGEAAQKMSDALTDFYIKPEEYSPNQESLQRLLFKANLQIYGWGKDEQTGQSLGGCAGTIAWCYNEKILIFHAGDSSGLLISNKEIEQATSRHQINNEYISRYFGQGPKLKLEYREYELTDYSYFLLATDGVTKVIDNTDLASMIVRYKMDIKGAVSEIASTARAKGSKDDITAILIDLVELEP